MGVLLHIDTAVQGASLCISVHENIIAFSQNEHTKEGAGWIHVAFDELMKKAGITLQQLEAISISAGPGSYTGLRVGMAAAKGLCYALNIPIISISTLKMMAAAAPLNHSALLCPMIDARRMEVFTALYDKDLNVIISPHNLILTADSFATYLKDHQILFFGNGSEKFSSLQLHPNAMFMNVEATAKNLVPLANKLFMEKNFNDLAYAEPFYGKEFYSHASAVQIK